MTAKTLMVQGTASSTGKSLLTAALCRCFARRGLRVAPFKAQNMSNNAAVCRDGAEIGRSQALQAWAAGVTPTSDMNPILLKPEGDTHSQVLINGRPLGSLGAAEYFKQRHTFWPVVTSALDRLRSQYDLVIIEGAGSPAELNLSDVELVNMAVARYCHAPVILVGDIERGGVFAQLLGTLWLLSPEDRALVCGLIVNKFRGDMSLFDRGAQILQQRGEVPVLGVLPWLADLNLPEEDAVALSGADDLRRVDQPSNGPASNLHIAVIHLPHIANFDDFDPLAAEPGVQLVYARSPEQLGQPDVIIIPGTKNTLEDLNWLRTSGCAQRILELAAQRSQIVGICGGYQMLGKRLHNPHRSESDWEAADGLGLLDAETTFRPHSQKQTRQVSMTVVNDQIAPGVLGQTLVGYEIHVGHTESHSTWLRQTAAGGADACDGAIARKGRVWGCYLHGLFHNDLFRTAWLSSLGLAADRLQQRNANDAITQSLDRLADMFERHIDMRQLEQIIEQQGDN